MDFLKVNIKLFGGLKAPNDIIPDENGIYSIRIEENFTISKLIDFLSLTGKPLIVVVNGIICNNYDKKINDGDIISFFPPVAGG